MRETLLLSPLSAGGNGDPEKVAGSTRQATSLVIVQESQSRFLRLRLESLPITFPATSKEEMWPTDPLQSARSLVLDLS